MAAEPSVAIVGSFARFIFTKRLRKAADYTVALTTVALTRGEGTCRHRFSWYSADVYLPVKLNQARTYVYG